jgi:hypothetical protein
MTVKLVETPRMEWALIGDAHAISANKVILVWQKRTDRVIEAVVLHSEDDERGDLYTEDAGTKLDWDDYCHYCYKTPPKASSADKELAVYARSRASVCGQVVVTPWKLVWRGQPHETNKAIAVEDALRAAGCEVTQTKTGHPPSKDAQ